MPTYPIYNYGGREIIDEDPYDSPSGVYADNTKAYTEVSAGTIKLGYLNGGSRTATYTLSPASSGNYLGLAINANRIYIMSQSGDTSHYRLRMHDYLMANGYLQVVTRVTESQASGVSWEIDRIPFCNGLCVSGR